ncbi:hypothetical protein ACS0TY_031232 [Phlomoides rotata]
MNTKIIQVLVHFSLLPFLCFSLETDTISSELTFKDPESIVSQNQRQPLNDSSGAVAVSDGNLVLINGRNQTVWSTDIAPTAPINSTSVQILDTGNLVLRSYGVSIWESFSHITNCFLPTMKLSHNIITGKKVTTSSWKNGSDPEAGSFFGGLEASEIPQMFTWNKNGRPYWRSGQWNGVILNGIKGMYDPYNDGFTVGNEHNVNFYFTAPQGNPLMKICLNSSGSIVQTLWDDQNSRWIDAWWAPENECDVYGKCGPFGSCNIQGTPICSCMRGFEPVDNDEWGRGNWSGGCRRTKQLQCDSGGGRDAFFRLQFMKVPDFAEQIGTRQEDECRSRCLGNCSCIAYAHDRSIGCMLWSDSLIDAQDFNTVGVDLYIRLSDSEFGDKTKGRKINDAGQTLSTDSTAIVLKDESDVVNIEELPLFTFETLANATDQFHESNLLGRGGFGPVYKGNLGNGKEIAVKRLSEASGQGVEEFTNEVIVISKLQHRNLVRLLGCCVEKEEKMLIYEYMPNKSLDVCLFDPTHPSQSVLNWTKRFSIIEGIGSGLLYLHRDSRLRIIHRDLKPSNVLLDEDWNPKISDFGMARMFGGNQDHANTARVVGTYGYMAPEYAMGGRFSEKSDVFSFGVLILEITSGRKNTSFNHQDGPLNLLGYVWKLWEEGNVVTSIDPKISSPSNEAEVVRCINIGLLCVQELPQDRPSVSAVLSMLSSEIIKLPEPKQPAFTTKSSRCDAGMAGTSYSQQSKSSCSLNNVTLTVVEGR